jgi:hypothetical protein
MHEHYDSFVDEDPEVQERVARGELQGARKIVVAVVKARFPKLADLAQEQASHLGSIDMLSLLAKLIATVPNEATAYWLLNTF